MRAKSNDETKNTFFLAHDRKKDKIRVLFAFFLNDTKRQVWFLNRFSRRVFYSIKQTIEFVWVSEFVIKIVRSVAVRKMFVVLDDGWMSWVSVVFFVSFVESRNRLLRSRQHHRYLYLHTHYWLSGKDGYKFASKRVGCRGQSINSYSDGQNDAVIHKGQHSQTKGKATI